MRRGQPDLSQRLVVLRGLVELELVQLQLFVELQRVQLVLELLVVEFVELQLVKLVVLELTPAPTAPGARPAPGAFAPQRVSP